MYQKPPMFDAALTMTALEILQWAGFLLPAFGYWMISNK